MKKIAALLGCCTILAIPSLASAQELPRTPEGRALWFNARGDALIRSNPAEAAQFYLRAWAEVRNCDLLFNAASAFGRSNELNDLDRAVANYRLYLGSDPTQCRSLRGQMISVNQIISRLEAEIADRRRRLAAAPPTPPPPVLTLVQPPLPVVTPPPVVVTPHPVVEPPRYRMERSSPNLSYTLFGVGGLFLGYGIYSLAVAGSENSLSNQQGVTDPGRHARAADSASLWGGITTGLGVAAIGGGLAWYFLRPSHRVRVPAPVALHVSPQAVVLSARFRF